MTEAEKRTNAAKQLLMVLKNPIVLMSKPSREEALRLAREHDLKVTELLELAHRFALKT